MKLFLSGAENQKAFGTITHIKHPYVLMSFLYLRKKKTTLEQYLDKAGYDMKFMIDSGAHSFIDNGVAHSLKSQNPQNDVMRFIDEYLTFLDRNKKFIDLAVELDLQRAPWDLDKDPEDHVGFDIVRKWRQEIFSKLDLGFPIIFVNHEEPWEETASYGKFIGLSATKEHQRAYGKVFTLAKKLNIGVHGFAVTGKEIKRLPFTTVDSTSWLSGNRFGVTYWFRGSSMLTIDKNYKHRRRAMKKECEDYGIDHKLLMEDDDDAIMLWNAYQWKKYANWVEQRWTKMSGTGTHHVFEEFDKEKQESEGILAGIDDPPQESAHANSDPVQEAEDLPVAATRVPTTGITISLDNNPIDNLRCANCYIQETCPAFNPAPDATCSISVDLKIETGDDYVKLVNKVIEIQSERVLRGRMAERQDGGLPDKTLSGELNLLLDMIAKSKEIFDTRDSLVIKAKGKGILSKIFAGK
jgi:hypothetical protein